MRKLVATIAVLSLLAALAALGATVATGSGVSAAGTKTVTIGDDFFSPTRVAIHEGSIVKWVWTGANEHNVTQANRLWQPKARGFNSVTQSQGDPYRRRFRRDGTYYVICTVHPTDMRMRIIVREG